MGILRSVFPGFANFQAAKMSFTDLLPATLGATNTAPGSIRQNIKSFLNAKTNVSLSEGFQRFQEVFQNTEFLLGEVRNPIVQLFINPQSIRVNKEVLHVKQQTRGGFVIQFWGHDLEVIEVEAATAYFQLSKEPVRAFELLKRQTFQGRFHATQPFRGFPIVTMLFENQILKGYFTNFNYSISADKPFYATYTFRFVVTEDLTVFVGSNLASLISDITKKGSTIHSIADAASLNAEDHTLGRGWGIKLF